MPKNTSAPTSKGTRRNVVWSTAAYLAVPAAQLLAAPYLIRKLGTETYGVLLVVNSVIQMSGLSSLGFGDATIKYVAEFAAQKRSTDLINLLQTTLFLYLVLGGITVLTLSLAAPLIADRVFKIPAQFGSDAALAVRIGSLSLLLRLIYSVGESSCRGLRRYDIESSTAVVGSLLLPAANCLLASQGYGMVALIGAGVASQCVGNVIMAFRCSRLLGTTRWLLPTVQWENVRRLASFGLFSWVQMLGGALTTQADRLIIIRVLGPAAVTAYVICLQLTQMASGIVAQAFSYLFPLATELYVNKRWLELRRVFLNGMQLTSIASFAVAAILFIYGETILFLWMGNSLGSYDLDLVLVLATSSALMGTTIVPYFLLNGAGYVRLNAAFNLSSIAAMLPVSIILLRHIGMVGMAFGKMMNIIPGLIARIIIGRIMLKDSRILICFWHLLPTLGGLAVLWAAQFYLQISAHAAQRPGTALGILLAAISITSVLALVVYRPGSAAPEPQPQKSLSPDLINA